MDHSQQEPSFNDRTATQSIQVDDSSSSNETEACAEKQLDELLGLQPSDKSGKAQDFLGIAIPAQQSVEAYHVGHHSAAGECRMETLV
jgi:hypothetical protein